MTKNEIRRLLAWTVANFPHMQDKDLRPTAELWERMLYDMPYKLAENALVKVLSKTRYFPTVAEIREAALEIENPNRQTPLEAWDELVRAIRKYGYYDAEKGIESLSPSTKKIAKQLGWRELCTSETPDILRAHFLKMYERQAQSDKEMAQLPSRLRDLIQGKLLGDGSM